MLHTIRFTTARRVKTYDSKGKIISESQTDTEVCMTALPYSTALSYKGCDNFVIQEYIPDDRKKAHPGGDKYREVARESRVQNKTARPKSTHIGSVASAAETGDMSAALNA